MATMEVRAVLKGNRVVIESLGEAEPLLQGGYGSPLEDGGGSTLSPCEALYLVSEKRLKVVEGEGGLELGFRELLNKLRAVDEDVWTKYLIYRDLRKRGYVVRDGVGLGIDFRVYARGTYGEKAARYIVFGVCEGTPVPVKRLWNILYIALNMKKQLIVAVMDRRGEIVYYSLGTFSR